MIKVLQSKECFIVRLYFSAFTRVEGNIISKPSVIMCSRLYSNRKYVSVAMATLYECVGLYFVFILQTKVGNHNFCEVESYRLALSFYTFYLVKIFGFIVYETIFCDRGTFSFLGIYTMCLLKFLLQLLTITLTHRVVKILSARYFVYFQCFMVYGNTV